MFTEVSGCVVVLKRNEVKWLTCKCHFTVGNSSTNVACLQKVELVVVYFVITKPKSLIPGPGTCTVRKATATFAPSSGILILA